MSFPMEFKECPNCGCTHTVTQLAWQGEEDAGKLSEGSGDLFVSAEKVGVPLLDPKKGVPTLTMTILMLHFDVCAKCGTHYCTKADKQTGPVTMKMPPGGMGQLPGFQGPPFGKG